VRERGNEGEGRSHGDTANHSIARSRSPDSV